MVAEDEKFNVPVSLLLDSVLFFVCLGARETINVRNKILQ